MNELQNARERKGLSLDDVSSQVRIPRRYLVALESGDVDVLPPGSFRSTYHRQYRSFLGLPPIAEDFASPAAEREAPTTEVTSTTGTIPRSDEIPTSRLIMSGFAVTLLLVLLMQLGSVVVDRWNLPSKLLAGDEDAAAAADPTVDAAAEEAPVGPTVAQTVRLRAIEDVRVFVQTPEGVQRKGVIPGGETYDVESNGIITIEVSNLTRVVVTYNGNRIEPLHNLSKGRRLVFVPEGGQ